jgi:hypothetical protein
LKLKILLKTEIDDKVVTVFQVPTTTILEGGAIPESTETNMEIGDFIEDIIDGLQWPLEVLNATRVIEQSIEIAWLKQALEQERDEIGLRKCLRGIRTANFRGY